MCPWVALKYGQVSLFHPKPNHIILSLDRVLLLPPDTLISLPLLWVPTPPHCPVLQAAARLSFKMIKTLMFPVGSCMGPCSGLSSLLCSLRHFWFLKCTDPLSYPQKAFVSGPSPGKCEASASHLPHSHKWNSPGNLLSLPCSNFSIQPPKLHQWLCQSNSWPLRLVLPRTIDTEMHIRYHCLILY